MKGDGLLKCARHCHNKKRLCPEDSCRLWIDYPKEFNCCLIAIHENGAMTLREVGERIGLSFARIKQIETIALKKMKRNTLLTE